MSEAEDRDERQNKAAKYHNITASGHSRVINGNVYGNLIYQGHEASSLGTQCLRSLAFPDMMQRRDGIAPKAENTCEWILEDRQYIDWCKKGGILWIKGRAGTGKSTLMRSVVRDAESRATAEMVVLSYFFHRRGSPLQYTVLGLLRSLLHQILSRDERLLDAFVAESSFEKRCKNEGTPGTDWHWTESNLQEKLAKIFHICAEKQTVRLYIDALDEAGEATARDFMLNLQHLRLDVGHRLNMYISCRPYPDVIWKYDHLIAVEKCNHQDIAAYLDLRFKHATGWGAREDTDEIKSLLLARASGIFQWIVLVTDRILQLRNESMNFVLNEIRHVPKELEDLYEDMLSQLNVTDQAMALSILRWIVFAARPLSLTELRYAVTIDPAKPLRSTLDCHMSESWCDTDKEMSSGLLRLSRGLAIARRTGESEYVVGFDHESVRDYMLKRGISFLGRQNPCTPHETNSGHDHHLLSTYCVRLLAASDVLGVERSRRRYPFVEQPKIPILDYAVRHWSHHAVLAEKSGISQADLIDITEWPSFEVWTHWHRLETRNHNHYHERTTLQHVAARYGLVSIMQKLIPSFQNSYLAYLTAGFLPRRWRPDGIETMDSHGMTPLSVAAKYGQDSMVGLLLSTGQVDVNSKCFVTFGPGDTPLSKAVRGGHTKVVKLLLQNQKVSPDFRDWSEGTPLMIAADKGYEDIFQLLLGTNKVAVGAKNKYGYTALSKAARGGHLAIVKALIDTHKVNVDSRDTSNQTVFSQAVHSGNKDVVKLLLNHCDTLSIDSKDESGQTPLSVAARLGYVATVQLLIGTGKVYLDSRSNNGETPFWFAACMGHAELVRLFLGSDQVDVNCRDTLSDYTPLATAAANGRAEALKILMTDARVEVNVLDISGMTPLLLAARSGYEETVKVLLESGRVDVSVRDLERHWAALDWAMEYGRNFAESEWSFDTAKVLQQYTSA